MLKLVLLSKEKINYEILPSGTEKQVIGNLSAK